MLSNDNRSQEIDTHVVIPSEVCFDLTCDERVNFTFTRELGRELIGQHLDMLGLTITMALVVIDLHQLIKMTVI